MFDWEDSFNYRRHRDRKGRQLIMLLNVAAANNNPGIACGTVSIIGRMKKKGEVVWSQESRFSGGAETPQTSFYGLGCRKHSAL